MTYIYIKQVNNGIIKYLKNVSNNQYILYEWYFGVYYSNIFTVVFTL